MSVQTACPDGARAECGSETPSASPTTCDVAAVPRNWQPPPGVPLRDRSGQPMGTLCVIDREPRRLRSSELQALCDLADIASAEIGKKAA